jgi:hypothetical protein
MSYNHARADALLLMLFFFMTSPVEIYHRLLLGKILVPRVLLA